MANSIIQTLFDSISGRLFEESFEVSSWLTDQRWTIVRGNPQASSSTAQDGVRSFKVDTDAPLIEKALSTAIGALVVCLFDDISQTTSTQQPGILVGTAADFSDAFGVAVDNATSSVNYTAYYNGAPADSGIARSNGWHRIMMNWISPDSIEMFIDGVSLGSVAASGGQPTRMRLGCINDVDDTAWAYLDMLQVMRDIYVKVYATTGMVAKIYNSTGTLLDTRTATAGVANFVILASYNSPLDCYFTLTRPDGTTPYYYSDVRQVWTGDVYTFSVIDFGRKIAVPTYQPTVNRNDNEANSGKTAGVFFNARDRVAFNIGDLTDDQMRQLLAWWSHAQQQKSYGVAFDGADTLRVNLAAAVTPGSTTIEVDSAAGIGLGSKYILRRANNQYYEHVTVSAISGATITLTAAVLHSYSVDDVLRSVFYWPSAVSEDKNVGLTCSNPRVKRWMFQHRFKEEL